MSVVEDNARALDTTEPLSFVNLLCGEGDNGIPYFSSPKSSDDRYFDKVIGEIEDILMDDNFQQIQKRFLDKYYLEFDDCEENKLVYTAIHHEYISEIESFIEEQLRKNIPEFNMEDFTNMLGKKTGDNLLDGEVFEVLATFSDFLAFREMFTDYRKFKEGFSPDLSQGIVICNLKEAAEDFSRNC